MFDSFRKNQWELGYAAMVSNGNEIENLSDNNSSKDLTGRLHAHGAKVAIQLQHAGKVATQDMAAGRPCFGSRR